jgi:hypothetical protein
MMVNGSLTSYVYASTYNDPTYPDYGLVFIHGTNTSNYNVWSISPDGPAKGSGLHFIYEANATNIHSTTPKISFIGSSGFVGIGTTSPSAKLHVSGSSTALGGLFNGRLFVGTTTGVGQDFVSVKFNSGGTYSQAINIVDSNSSASGAAYLVLRKSDDTYIGNIRRSSTDNAIYVGGNSYLALGSGDTERVRIDSSGNVGIGTTSLTAKLQIASTNNQAAIYTTGATTGFTYLQIQNSGGSNYFGMSDSNGAFWSTTPYTSYHATIGTAANIPLTFTTNNLIRMLLDNSGNLGIGTVSPATKLEVYGVVRITESASGGILQMQAGSSALDFASTFYGGTYRPFTFTNGGSERMRIQSDGNVGIGTSSPSFPLTVNGKIGGTLYAASYIQFPSSGGDAGNTIIAANDDVKIGYTQTFIVKQSGNVGIGTSSPTYVLDVNSANDSAIRIRNGAGSANNGLALAVGSGTPWLDITEGAEFRIKGNTYANLGTWNSGNNTKILINSSGNVGIGTTSPACKLDVVGTIRSTSSEIFGFGASDNVSIRAASSVNVMGLYTSNSEKVRLAADGNLGIGTSNPVQKLHVVGAVYGTTYGQFGTAVASGTNASFAVFGSNSAVVGVKLVLDSDVNRNDLVVATTGNIGIGTSTPGAKLNTYASGSNLSVFKVDGGNGTLFEVTDQLSGSLFSVNDVSGLPLLEVFSNNRIVAGKYGSNALVISGSSVGIGTTTPAYKLQVNGSFGATTKSFVIDHPTKEGKKLVYGSLESPYHGIRLTGRNMLIDGECKVQLPDYIYKLARPESVNIQITPIKCGKVIYVDEISVENNYFVVKYDKSLLESYKNYEFFWDFTATRSDVEQLVVEQ